MRSSIVFTALIATALADWGTSTPDKCAADCTAAHDACVTKPDSNKAECASEYAACLGYNPYETGFVAPTACSKTTTSASWPTKTAAPPVQDECAKKCNDEYDQCRGAPGANQSTCSSEYAKCLGYNPFDGQHEHEEKPTKCSTQPAVTPTWTSTPPPKTDCKHVKQCTDEVDQCRTKPEANQAECSAEYAACLGFNPFTPEGEKTLKQCEEQGPKPGRNETHPKPPPIIVSGASGLVPLGVVSFLAVAAAALL
ncbi:hypothetical protein ACQKWADRAFT_277228 [Trichoderma austrokoningii]